MALKNQKTKSDYINWSHLLLLINKLEKKKDIFALLISLGIYSGLRISDYLSLTWSDVLEKDSLTIKEKKTNKSRTITINNELKEIIIRYYHNLNITDPDQYIFINRFGTKPITQQYVNRKLKDIMILYKVGGLTSSSHISSHSLRKSFGRRIYEQGNQSEKSLIMLSMLLNHSNLSTTKIYLAITDSEMADLYTTL